MPDLSPRFESELERRLPFAPEPAMPLHIQKLSEERDALIRMAQVLRIRSQNLAADLERGNYDRQAESAKRIYGIAEQAEIHLCRIKFE